VITTAVFSPCRQWRYQLSRIWRADLEPVIWVMLNPSTADETKDDPTIRRVIGFSMNWGYGGAIIYNLFAWRSPHPTFLRKTPDPVGPENDQHLVAIAENRLVICAWGNDGQLYGRSRAVLPLLAHCRLECLGTSKHTGEPKHPLYLRATMPRIPWRG
jgi:hypothetical protein